MVAEQAVNMDIPSDELEAEYGFEDKVGTDKDLAGDGGVIKTILKKGEGWETPEKGDDVTVHYVGTLLDGTKFDSSRDRGEPFNFKLGQGSVIKGWDVGVATMTKGEVARLTLKPGYAYGAAGSPPTIPPDATLVFEVELISWKSVKDITGDGGVIKTILAEGSGWQTPNPQDEVVLTYTASITDPPAAAAAAAKGAEGAEEQEGAAAVVASSPQGGAVFLASESPCSGLGAAVRSMKVGERARLLLKPDYAAGLADVPEGKLLSVDATLSALHPISTLAPGLTKKTLAKPEGSYMRPNEGSSVTVSVEVREGGSVLEARHEADFVLDEEQAPEALELCLLQMVEGEQALLTVSDPTLLAAPEAAVVGGSLTADKSEGGVVFDVTLVSFKKAKEKWEMNNAEKLAAAQTRKEKGNAAYKAGRITRAVRQYTAAYETANSISEQDMAPHPVMDAAAAGGEEGEAAAAAAPSKAQILAQAKDVKKASCLNLAAAALKQQQWGEAVKQAGRVLELDPSNVKALYRRAQARMALSELLEAELDIKAGLLSHPDNSDLAALHRRLKVQLRELNKKESKLYGRMFAALGRGTSDQGAAPATAADAAAGDTGAPMQEDAPAAGGAAAAAAPVVQAAA